MPKIAAPLTDTRIKNAKPKEKDYKLADGYGLYLLITPTGSKLWRYQYRFGGKQKQLALGVYPYISLADARQKREGARGLLAKNIDPNEMKKDLVAALEGKETFEVIALEWHTLNKSQWIESHAETILDRFKQEVFPLIGKRPLNDITAPELLAVLRRIESRGALDKAHRIRHHCSQIFKYGIATGKADRDPARDLSGILPPVKNKHYAAITDPEGIGKLLRVIEGYEGSNIVKAALQLAPLLFVRPGELRAMEWSELDLEAQVWSVPGHKMKMDEPHLVPLANQAVEIIKALKPFTEYSKYVMPCHRSPLRCMSENAVLAGLRRMGYTKEEITGHGFRATARTMLHERLGFEPDFIEAQLAHAVPDRLGDAYNRTKFIKQRTEMMQAWADYLDKLKGM